MISLEIIGSNNRDGTALYYASVDYRYTVGEFIKTVLDERKGEWGEIAVKINKGKKDFVDILLDNTDVNSCEYAYGKLKTRLKRKILKQNIVSIWAYGGYSCMDYIIIISNKSN